MTAKPKHILEIFLQPGEFYFGDEGTRIRTLLGSCVSITLWHPKRRIGGMCHYMLPSRGARREPTPDGHYADEVMALFLQEIRMAKTRPEEYEVKLFGGGDMFLHKARARRKGSVADPSPGEHKSVSASNIEAGRALIQQNGFKILAEDAGGNGRRHVIFDVWSGHVWVRRHQKTD